MTYQIAVVAPLNKPVLKELYRLSVEFMSGDGDHYETETYDFKTTEELGLYLGVLDLYNTVSWNEQCDIQEVKHWCELAGFKYDWRSDNSNLTPQQKAVVAFAENIPSDVQSDGDWQAAPSSWAVTYFDAEGVEHSVAIAKDDGSPFHLSRQG